MAISAVVLDMDGLMLDTEPLYKAAWQQAARELGFALDEPSYSRLIGRPTEACEAELMKSFGPGFPLSQFRSLWPELWQAFVHDRGIPCKPGLLALLSCLAERGVPHAIATSSDAAYTEFTLRRAGLSGRFKVVVTREQVAQGKPAPDIYLEAARRLGRDPSDCVALEDSDAGVLAASAAGMTTLCVPDMNPPCAAATRAAFRVVRSLDEARELIVGMLTNSRLDG